MLMNVKDAQDEAEAVVREFVDDDQRVERIRQLRQMKRPVALDQDMRFTNIESHSADIADEGFRIAQSLVINGIKVQVTPHKFGVQKYEKQADDLGRFSEAWLHKVGKKHAGEETIYAVADACVNDGGGWSKLIYSPQDWELRDNVRRKDYASAADFLEAVENAAMEDVPMRWVPIDVLSVYPKFNKGKLVSVYEITERPWAEMSKELNIGYDGWSIIKLGEPVEMAGQGVRLGDSRAPHSLKVIEVWTETEYTVIVCGPHNSYMAPVQLHGLPRVPYFYTPGLMMNWWRGRKVALSAGELKSWLVEYKDFLRTLQANAAMRDVFAPLHRERPADGAQLFGLDGRPITETKYNLGMILEGNLGEKVTALQFPDVSPNLQNEMKATNVDLQNLMTPRTRADLGNVDGGAGFAISQVVAEAKVSHSTFQRHLQETFTEVIALGWWLIKYKIQDKVYVESTGGDGFIGVGPDELDKHVGLAVYLDPEQPSGKLIEGRFWLEQINGGLAYPEQAIREMGGDPSEVEFMLMRRQMMQSPWFTMLFQQEVAQSLGAGDILSKAHQAQELAANGGRGGGQAPGGMGSQIVPDMGNQALRPVAPGGGTPGAGPGAVVTEQGGAAGMTLGR